MTRKTSPTIEEYKALKKECAILRLNLRQYRNRFAKLRNQYNEVMRSYFDGVKVYENHSEELKDIFHISLTQLAHKFGISTSTLSGILLKNGIIKRVTPSDTYLVNPYEHGKYVLFKKVRLRHCERLALYWNMDGMRFLYDLLVENGISPKRRIDFTTQTAE